LIWANENHKCINYRDLGLANPEVTLAVFTQVARDSWRGPNVNDVRDLKAWPLQSDLVLRAEYAQAVDPRFQKQYVVIRLGEDFLRGHNNPSSLERPLQVIRFNTRWLQRHLTIRSQYMSLLS
jgi:hypothetical protein